jgi:hypothetical protein
VSVEVGKHLSIVALVVAGLLGLWAAWACRRARTHGLPGGDAVVWAGLASVFLVLSQTKLARVLGLLKGLGGWLRWVAREHGLYAGRRPFQVAATVAVVLTVVVLLVIGIVSFREYLKRYRLAIGFASLAVGFGVIRFISLHEVDAWSRAMPWLRVGAELLSAAGASTLAAMRLRQLRGFAWPRRPGG